MDQLNSKKTLLSIRATSDDLNRIENIIDNVKQVHNKRISISTSVRLALMMSENKTPTTENIENLLLLDRRRKKTKER